MLESLKNIIKSGWKSKVTSSIALAAAADVVRELSHAVDSLDSTTTDWAIVTRSLMIAVGFFFSRDANVTSEDSGAKSNN